MTRRELWFGDGIRFGILQRLGIAAFLISLGLVYVAFEAPGDGHLAYWLFFAAHAVLYAGFVVAALGDAWAGRRFSAGRLLYVVAMGFLYAILCPVVMSAAAAAARVAGQ